MIKWQMDAFFEYQVISICYSKIPTLVDLCECDRPIRQNNLLPKIIFNLKIAIDIFKFLVTPCYL